MSESGSAMPSPAESGPKPAPPTAHLKRNLLWRALHPPFWLFCHTWLRLRSCGLDNIDNTRGGLLLINHQSYLDPLLAAVLLSRPVSYLARDSLFQVPLVGSILRRTHVTPISREAVRGGSIRTAMERLDEGFLVGIFPEGTRSSGDNVARFRSGFLALARRTNQPIYPVGIAGADRVMPRGAWWIRPGAIGVAYGEPFNAEEVQGFREESDRDSLAEFARARVAACQRAAARLL